MKVIDNFFTVEECTQILNEIENAPWQTYPDIDFQILGKCHQRYIRTDPYILEQNKKLDNDGYKRLFRQQRVIDDLKERAYQKFKQDSDYTCSAHSLLIERLSLIFPKIQYTTAFSKSGFQKWIKPQKEEYFHYDNGKMFYPYEKEFSFYKGWMGVFDQMYSITLMLTAGNFTYEYYPDTVSRYEDPNRSCKHNMGTFVGKCDNPKCNLDQCETVYYKQGTLIIAEGKQLHRPGIIQNESDCPRITMQSHALMKDGIFYLYW